MAKIKIGINGLGRIGRTILRETFGRNLAESFDIVAVNNPGKALPLVHLLKHDSVHGKFSENVQYEEGLLRIGSKDIRFFGEKDPTQIPWEDLGVQIVIDATGVFKDGPGLSKHKKGSVQKVIMCAPGNDLDGTFVMGINHQDYDPAKHHIVSNASCTTNCLAPTVKPIHEKFGIESGMMTTVHAYTSDQQLLDGSHSDLRRARAAALSMIPTTTGAAKAVGLVYPELKGKLDGYAVRVPTPNVSMVDVTLNLKNKATKEEINTTLKAAAEGPLKGILAYTDEPLVSQDFNGLRESACVDGSLTNVIGNSVKIVSWYDNEVGFSNRVIDLATYMGERL